jgi:hypothetical protein
MQTQQPYGRIFIYFLFTVVLVTDKKKQAISSRM